MNRTALTCPVLSGLSDEPDSKRLSGPVRSVRYSYNTLILRRNIFGNALSDCLRTARNGVEYFGHLEGKGKPPLGGFPFPLRDTPSSAVVVREEFSSDEDRGGEGQPSNPPKSRPAHSLTRRIFPGLLGFSGLAQAGFSPQHQGIYFYPYISISYDCGLRNV